MMDDYPQKLKPGHENISEHRGAPSSRTGTRHPMSSVGLADAHVRHPAVVHTDRQCAATMPRTSAEAQIYEGLYSVHGCPPALQ